jgi:predicted small secreted protein
MLRPLRRLRAALVLASLVLGGCATAGGAGSEKVDSPEFAARCEAEVLTASTPTTPAEAAAAKEAGASWTNDEVREVYLCTIAGIDEADAELEAAGASLEERARAAYATRHNARITSRAMMSDPDEVAKLEARDLEKYGDKDGPTFAYLMDKGRAEGKSDDEIYADMIGSAQRTNRAVNRRSR